jgi:hypothetical protein
MTGVRGYPARWGSGAIYVDLRLSYMVADGPDPFLRTQSWGMDIYFGVELGIRPVYAFVEGGYGFRKAFFRKSAGWLGTPESFDTHSGLSADMTRLGVRVYF